MSNHPKFSGHQSGHQSGFTLVELAIVLVIIGLILGAVLKGQEMIENGKVKSVINDLRGVSTAYYAYQDRYKAIPGDDAAAATHASAIAVAGGGNGLIAGRFNDVAAPATATESNNFWQHTRLAGFTTGEATATKADPPNNSQGGVLGVESGAFAITGNVVCTSNIPWKTAQAVDIALDDGNNITGTIRTGLAGAAAVLPTATAPTGIYGGAVAVPSDTDTLHTVCMKI